MCLPSKVKGYTVQAFAVLVGNLEKCVRCGRIVKRLYFHLSFCVCVILGNLLNLNLGLTIGVTPSHAGLYEEDRTPLNRAITSAEATWVAGSFFLSAALGSLVFGLVSSKIGPKSVMLLSGLLQITSWFCIHFAYDILHIYSSRICAGIAAGAAFTVLPIYISEIGETSESKASLTVSLECWRALGILIGFALGSYLRYSYVSIVGIIVSLMFSMTFPFVQESPYYFLRKGNMASFEKSLRWFRGIRSIDDRNDPEFEHELNQIKNSANRKSQIVESELSTSRVLRLFIAGLVLTVGVQLSGTYTIFHHGSVILTTAAPLKLSINASIMILAVVHVFGTIVAKCLCSTVNRRILLFVTSLISALCLILAAMYLSYGKQWQIDEDLQQWIMPILLAVHILFASVGYFSLATTTLTEIIPRKSQCRFLSLLHLLMWLTAFILIQFYEPIVHGTSTASILVLFAIGCVTVTVGSLFSFARKLHPKEMELKLNEQSLQNGSFTNIHI